MFVSKAKSHSLHWDESSDFCRFTDRLAFHNCCHDPFDWALNHGAMTGFYLTWAFLSLDGRCYNTAAEHNNSSMFILRLEIVFVGWIKPILRYPPLPNDEVMEPHSGRFDVVTSNDSSDMTRSGLDYAALVDNSFSRWSSPGPVWLFTHRWRVLHLGVETWITWKWLVANSVVS